MRSAAVGHQCVECVDAGAKTVRQPRVHSTAAVTYALIAINLLAFVAQNVSAQLESDMVLWPPAVAHGDWYRLVTSAFLHYGLMHLLFNMWALYVIGPPLEARLGRWRFGALYALSALGGSVAVYLIAPLNTATAGASGAVFGLFGATFVVAKRLNLDVRWVVGLIVINLLLPLVVPHISWQGHVGGLITGAVLAAAFGYAPAWVPRQRRTLIPVATSVAVLALFTVLIWWRTAGLLQLLGSG
jgi:membrane associated rhomboid family serine protease